MEKINHFIPDTIPNYIVQKCFKHLNERDNYGYYFKDSIVITDNTVAVFKIKLKSQSKN